MSSTRSQGQLCTTTPVPFLCSVFTFHFGFCLRQSAKYPQVITLVAELIDAYGIHH